MNTINSVKIENKMSQQKGFTIIELLVVIVIIGILAALSLSVIRGIQERSRDTVRISNFELYDSALNAYAVDHSDRFPCGAGHFVVDGLQYSQDNSSSGGNGFITGDSYQCSTAVAAAEGLSEAGYLQEEAPLDPVNIPGSGSVGGRIYRYIASPDRRSFVLITRLESDSNDDLSENDGGLCDNYYELFGGPERIPLDAYRVQITGTFRVACSES